MANDLNSCNFIGRLGNDPEIRFLPDGKAVASFSIACGESWKDQQGNKQERVEWVNCSAFGKLAEIIGEYLRKGSQVHISGKMKTEKWKDQSGQDRYTTKIIVNNMQMLGGKSESNGQPQQSNHRQQQAPQQRQQPQGNYQPQQGMNSANNLGDGWDDDINF